jgi:hypothetical protein
MEQAMVNITSCDLTFDERLDKNHGHTSLEIDDEADVKHTNQRIRTT